MDYIKAQKDVDGWIGQFKISYFSPHEIITQLSEENGELAEAINNKNSEQIGEELADVVFALICMTNRHKIMLKEIPMNTETKNNSFLYLTRTLGQLAREVSHMYGPKKKKSTEEQTTLTQRLLESFEAINFTAKEYNVDVEKVFSAHMNKMYGRDNNRWEKK